jgi:hypothetical protein
MGFKSRCKAKGKATRLCPGPILHLMNLAAVKSANYANSALEGFTSASRFLEKNVLSY